MSFLDNFNDNILKYPNKIVLEFIDPPFQRITYAELGRLVNQTAGYLQSLGAKPGDRIALQLSKCVEFILLHLATVQLGCISLPLNLAYPADELKYFLEDSGSKLFFALEPNREKLQSVLHDLHELQECILLDPGSPNEFRLRIADFQGPTVNITGINDDDTAVIIYTSGTTGRPKGAEITHGNLISNLQALHDAWGWQQHDVLLHVLPIFHVHGLFVALHGAFHAGATTFLMREFNVQKTLELLSGGQCTIFMAVPTIHKRLLDSPNAQRFDLSKVRLITSGSDRLPDEIFTGFQQTFGYTLLERYGMTETGMNCSNPLQGERRMGSVGRPLTGVQVRIVHSETGSMLPLGEIGEVQLHGTNVFKGYWQQHGKTSEAFSQDGWFKTGDLGYLEADGYLTLCGRSKDLIISGGLNIYPPEVERILMEHPAIEACAVIGCPDSEWGERVTAVVVLQKTKSVSSEDLILFCREKLAPYKSPKSIIFKEELPRNAMGKVQKTELRKTVCK
jgi:malonyl-CoA/methylmalonyl-CoA synthetase